MPNLKTSSGVLWEYEDEGNGQVVLFLHGWGVDRRIWKQQAKYFSSKFRIITVDLPGHGNTPWRNSGLDLIAKDLAELLDKINAGNFIVVGSSLGGLVSLKLYEHIPKKIQKMVFVGSMPKFAKSHDYEHGLDVENIRKLEWQLNTSFPNIMHIFFRSLFTKEERASRRFKWLQIFRRASSVPDKDALEGYLEILEKEDLRETLRKVKVPVQFINGREDSICSRDTVEFIKTIIPQARYDYFDKCGHFPFLSKPHEFNKVLEEFIV